MERNFEINGDGLNIRCKLFSNPGQEIRRVIVFGHGFAGHKDNTAAAKFADKVLTKYKGTAVLIFNWPCHGDDVRKKMSLPDCLAYLDHVVAYIRERYETEEIYAYATSFGGYLILKYLADYGNPFRAIALRCPAVNMHQVLMHSVVKAEEYEKLQKGKTVPIGFDRKIGVTMSFLKELEDADIRGVDFLDYAEQILILHGTKDEVVPFADSQSFCDDNLIELLPVEGADHRFQNPKHMEIATKAVLAFFGFA